MNIVLISQCSKQALPASRRILDQFAERKGARTWLTPITVAGLDTLHELLRRGARRNTAVSCHRVRGGEMELLWIVGNRRKFDARGNVPTDTTSRRVLDHYRERGWRHTESIALLAAIAGLFHDFGKANALFAAKLVDARAPRSEPWRHEWLSVRLFEAFVGNSRTDTEWLEKLSDMPSHVGDMALDALVEDKIDSDLRNPLKRLSALPVAQAVVWLVCTHHRLPVPRTHDVEPHHAIRATNAANWVDKLGPGWITPRRKDDRSDWKKLWSFPAGLPTASSTWCEAASTMGRRAVRHAELTDIDWMQRPLALHVARCALMLSDHLYSSGPARSEWQDGFYTAYANTEWIDGPRKDEDRVNVPKQKLDEHCIGVSRNAYLIAKSLPTLRSVLPAIGNVRSLRRRSIERFAWQNRAFAVARQVADVSRRQGGFFVDMASTGTGKTLANARMAFGLSEANDGCRFTVLLGLRTLTLQTADALRERIGLSESDLAVLVGSAAVRELHEQRKEDTTDKIQSPGGGSESALPLFAEHEYVQYEGELEDTRVGRWLKNAGKGGKLHRLISAPVVVGTIDHVMPATESARGGHQIAPMLRLLTSDLVLDEPDEFDLSDQPALCRLVHWAGLLGSRVLLSSATLPPSLLETLFDAYRSGRQHFNDATEGGERPIVCGWVDEFKADHGQIASVADFRTANSKFVKRRLQDLQKVRPRRSARLVSVAADAADTISVHEKIARVVLEEACTLHALHGETSPDGRHRVSVGIVRMANIDPLVRVARAIAGLGCASADVHLCVYHARHPLYRRAEIERALDDLLNRHDPKRFWKNPSVVDVCKRERRDQLFVVLSTAVAEVGRDHCYDWAIVEPSSMRSIVQLVGRVLRHREDQVPEEPNVALLRHNVLSLNGESPAFIRPGYESKELSLESHDLEEVLTPEHYRFPSAASRLREAERSDPSRSLVDLEHVATRRVLDGEPDARNYPASLWWKCATWWSYALQARTPFRAGQPTELYAVVADEVGAEPVFEHFTNGEWISSASFKQEAEEIEPTEGIVPWPAFEDEKLFAALDERYEAPLEQLCRRYMSLPLRELRGVNAWSHHWWLGVHLSPRS